MANIAEAAVLIKANASAMDSGLRQAETKLQKFSSSASRILGGTVKAAALAIAAGAAESIRRAIAFGGEVKDLAENFNLSAESASRLAFAAEQVGISTSTLTTHIGRVARMLGEAIGGSSEASSAFMSLGLSAETLANVPVDEAFTQVIEKLGSMTNASERAAAAQSIFGRGWQEIMELVRGGRSGLDEAAKLAARMGVIFSSADLARMEELKRATNEVGLAFRGVGAELVREWGGVLLVVLNAVRDALIQIRQEVRGTGGTGSLLAGAADLLGSRVRGDESGHMRQASIRALSPEARARLSPEAFGARTISQEFAAMQREADLRDQMAAREQSRRQAVAEANAQSIRTFEQSSQSILEERIRLEQGTEALERYRLARSNLTDAQVFVLTTQRRENEELRERRRLFDEMAAQAEQLVQSTTTPLERQAKELERIDALWQEGFIDVYTYTRALEQLEAQQQRTEVRSGAALGAGTVGAADALTAFQNQNLTVQNAPRNPEIERRLDQANNYLNDVRTEMREMRRELAVLNEEE